MSEVGYHQLGQSTGRARMEIMSGSCLRISDRSSGFFILLPWASHPLHRQCSETLCRRLQAEQLDLTIPPLRPCWVSTSLL